MVPRLFRSTVFAGLAAAVFAGACAYADPFVCETERARSPYPVSASPFHDHDRYAPRAASVIEYAAFVSSFDGDDNDNGDGRPDRTAQPEWVAYQLIGVTPSPDGSYREPDVSIERPRSWYRTDMLSFLWEEGGYRPGLDRSYSGIGARFNRGHFAMADHAQRISPEASCNTHVFTNASPQAASLNQGPWLHLETYSAALSNMVGNVWIVTGPIFDEDPIEWIGDPGETPVAIPDAFFKLLVIELPSGRVDWRALIYEHPHRQTLDGPVADGDWTRCTQAQEPYDHSPQLVSLETLEVRTGFSFLESEPTRAVLYSHRHDALWSVPERFWSGFRCGPSESEHLQ